MPKLNDAGSMVGTITKASFERKEDAVRYSRACNEALAARRRA
jgi:hypothetical protein